MKEKISIKIVVCYHKQSNIIFNSVYQPIHVGKETSNVSLPIQADNEGENISNRNCLYCELTGLYWAWKNIDSDFIGLAHYRRLYSFTSVSDRLKSIFGWSKYGAYRIAYGLIRACGNIMFYPLIKTINNEENLRKITVGFEKAIVQYLVSHPQKALFALHPVRIGNLTNYYFFSMAGGKKHIDIIKEIVEQNFPSVYPFLVKTLKQNKLYYANMSIMRKDVFDEYCTFLFTVLDKHYNKCLNEGYFHSKDEKGWSRLSGYMGEYLTSTFILYYKSTHKKSLKLLSMVNCDF